MKSKIKTTLIAFAGAGLFANPAMGAVSLESGSLAVAFYQVISGVVQPNTYVFDLGQASNYRENTGLHTSVSTISGGPTNSNIGTDLVAVFGSNWANAGNVRWMVVGNVGQTDATVGGDTAKTSYYSRGKSNFAVGTTMPTVSAANRTGSGNAIEAFFNFTQNEVSSANNADGTTIATSQLGDIAEYVTASPALFFTLGTPNQYYQTLSSGTIANSPFGTFEGALDIYRVIDTTTGTDLTAGFSKLDAVVGANAEGKGGQYIGTLTLNSAGNIGLVPEPTAALLGVVGAAAACLRRRRNA
jgi:MYXO-CTERM domain-containing protein